MKRVIVVHGWNQKPSRQWLPWLVNQIKLKGYEAVAPEFLNAKYPQLDSWLNTLATLNPDDETILVGHSLGCALILRYLEKENIKLKAAVLVAAWDWLLEDLKVEHLPFFDKEFNYEGIKNKNIPLTIINSTNDPYINFDRAKPLAQKIGAKFIPVDNAGHFMTRHGYSEFPLLLDVVIKELEK